jgi:hypothetical protein
MNPILEEYAVLLGATERNAQGGFLAFCPAHPDTQPSLSVSAGDTVDVIFFCHAGCSQEAVLLALAELRQRPRPQVHTLTPVVRVRPKRIGHCTVAALAEAKKLPEEFLESLGLRDHEGTVIIPYRTEGGNRSARHRRRWEVRAGDGGSSWTGLRGSGGIVPYGLHFLAGEGRPFCFVVEGESDAWTLWFAGLPALGVPGASMTHVLEPRHVAQFDWLIVWQEPGNGGEVFVKGLAEQLPNMKLRVVRGEDLGAKDPSDLWCRDPDVTRFKAALRKAVRP